MSEGVATSLSYYYSSGLLDPEEACKRGLFRLVATNFYTKALSIKILLKVSPVTVAMAIPGCNTGVLRGGNSSSTEFRSCVDNSSLLAQELT